MRLLRRVSRANWQESIADEPEAAPGDSLRDLRTESNKLSVWIIADDSSDLGEAVCAITLGGDYIDKFDLILFDDALLRELDIKIEEETARTPVLPARPNHRILTELSAPKLSELATALFRDGLAAGGAGKNVQR